MSEETKGIMLHINGEGKLEVYDDTYDITIHCTSKEEQESVENAIKGKMQQWIPCSERMPETDEAVLVWFEYYRYGEYRRLYQMAGISHTYRGRWSGFVNGQSGWTDLRILAWMPLPEAYEEKQEKICKTCAFCDKEWTENYMCVNEKSDKEGSYVDENDRCERWVGNNEIQ